MGQKGHILDQKGLKMHEKGQKIEFSNLQYLGSSSVSCFPYIFIKTFFIFGPIINDFFVGKKCWLKETCWSKRMFNKKI